MSYQARGALKTPDLCTGFTKHFRNLRRAVACAQFGRGAINPEGLISCSQSIFKLAHHSSWLIARGRCTSISALVFAFRPGGSSRDVIGEWLTKESASLAVGEHVLVEPIHDWLLHVRRVICHKVVIQMAKLRIILNTDFR